MCSWTATSPLLAAAADCNCCQTCLSRPQELANGGDCDDGGAVLGEATVAEKRLEWLATTATD